jgi:hypothetical protein
MTAKEMRDALRAERRAAKNDEALDVLKGLGTLGVAGLIGWGWLFGFSGDINQSSGQTAAAPVEPYVQTSFVASLERYRDQYSVARSNDNDIQMNRVFDGRKADFLCQTSPTIEDWRVQVYKVNTNWVNDRQKAWVVLQVSKNVWFNTEIVDATENSALFESIANLKQGDKVWVSGKLRREGDLKDFTDYLHEEEVKAKKRGNCLREFSATQYGGMSTPEFGITLSSIGKSKADAAPPAEPTKIPEPTTLFYESPVTKGVATKPKSPSTVVWSNEAEIKRLQAEFVPLPRPRPVMQQ